MADYLHRCFVLTLVLISCSPNHLIAKSCSAMQTFPSVSTVYDSPCMTWTVYWTLILCRLPTLIQPAFVIWLLWVFAASPDPKPELWFWFCLAYVVFEACDWTLPVWLSFCFNKSCTWILMPLTPRYTSRVVTVRTFSPIDMWQHVVEGGVSSFEFSLFSSLSFAFK